MIIIREYLQTHSVDDDDDDDDTERENGSEEKIKKIYRREFDYLIDFRI